MRHNHKQIVAELSRQVAKFYACKQPFKIFHGSTNSTRIQVFKRSEMLDTSGLNRVLEIDTKRQTALVEPNVPMDRLVKATLRHGLIPPVVMEFPGITVGGGVQGGAGESSSFRYGVFHETCESYEMIAGDGETLTCSPEKHPDLYYGTACSYGTLGVMTAVKLRLIPAQKYVNLTYIPVQSFDEAIKILQKLKQEDYDYIDGIMYSKDRGVIMAGKLSDAAIDKVQHFTRARDEWFYLHADKIATNAQKITEGIPVYDYLFRYDRGAFWMGMHAFKVFNVPFSHFWRTVLNWMLHARKLGVAMQESGISQEYVVQDLAIPVEKATLFLKYINESFGIKPLWLCPLKTDHTSPFSSSNLDTSLVINVGVWSGAIRSRDEFLQINRAIEKKVSELGGKKWFYAHAYYPENEFWNLYRKDTYDALRTKYHATHLPSTYDKVRVRDTFPIDTHRGLWRTLLGKAKLRIEP